MVRKSESSGSLCRRAVSTPSVTTSSLVAAVKRRSKRICQPTSSPSVQPRSAAIRAAMARAATRRGCNSTTGPSASSAGGTRVVFPAPGAAVTTTARDRRTESTIESRYASIGSGARCIDESGAGLTSDADGEARSRSLIAGPPELVQPMITAAADAVHLVGHRVRLVVMLVVVFAAPEHARRQHLRHYPREAMRLFDGGLRRFSGEFLRLVCVEDDRPILRAVVAELSGAVGRIDVVPVLVQQCVVGNSFRIENDLHRLGMAGDAHLHLLVTRILRRAASIADGH